MARSVLLAAAAVLVAAPAADAAGVEVRAPREVVRGDVFTVTLHGRGVAAHQATLRFDHAAATLLAVRHAAAAGRHVQALGPVHRRDAEVFGAYSCPAARCGLPAARGTSDSRRATVELMADRPGLLRLRLSGVRTVSAGAGRAAASRGAWTVTVRILPERATAAGGRTTARIPMRAVGAPRAARLDVARDGRVDRSDAAVAALAWTTAREEGRRGNGIARVQRVAAAARRPPARARAGAALTFTVDSTADTPDARLDTVCRTAADVCTLRAAIQEANAHAGPDAIRFAIAGTGVKTIRLASALPPLSDASGGTTINGYTQSGSAVNTAAQISNAQLRVAVAGTGYTADGLDALGITSADNVVTGIAFHDLRRSLRLSGSGASGNVVRGCFIGTDPTGTRTAATYNSAGTGIVLENGAHANRIGDTTAAARNVVSGNAQHGIATYGDGTDGNLVYNNLIGLSPGGDRRLANGKHGIDVNSGSAFNRIGGTGSHQRNVISGNGFPGATDFTAGVEVSHSASTEGNQVTGNHIGTAVSGATAPEHARNSHYGIRIEDAVTATTVSSNVIAGNLKGGIKVDAPATTQTTIANNRIGVTTTGAAAANGEFGVLIAWRATRTRIGPGNTIAHNPVGVLIGHQDSDGHTLTRNAMYANGGLGIDLEPWPGTNANDARDADAGANQQLNWPVLTSVGTTRVAGTACPGCTVELFRADGAAGAYGEGRTFLASAVAGSSGAFSAAVSLAAGTVVTATATDAAGNTSEFSLNVAAR